MIYIIYTASRYYKYVEQQVEIYFASAADKADDVAGTTGKTDNIADVAERTNNHYDDFDSLDDLEDFYDGVYDQYYKDQFDPVDEGAIADLDDVNDAVKSVENIDTTTSTERARDVTAVIDKSGSKTLQESTPKEIANMTRKELQDSRPEGWDFQNHNGRIHIKDGNGNYRVRIDPPDKKTNYPHIHIMDENKNPLDINGNIVSSKSPSGHIPYNN